TAHTSIPAFPYATLFRSTATTLTALIDSAMGNAQGSVLYRDTNANGWKVLAPGTSGQDLQTQGAAANPTWATATTGSVTNVATDTGITHVSTPSTDTNRI